MLGAKVLMKSLESHGVEYIFGIVGREASAILFDECPNIKFILTRHEFTAGIMADVYARLTQKPQVCFSTLGPGATNLSTGVASACLDRSSVVAISAQVESFDISYNNTHQCIDQVSLMRPLVKYSKEIYNAKDIPRIINKAFYTTKGEPRGPVFVSIPIDLLRKELLDKEAEMLLKKYSKIKEPVLASPNKNKIRKLYDGICKAKHPLVIVGNEIIRENAVSELRVFLERYNIPMVSSYVAKGILPADHTLNYQTISCYLDGILEFKALESIFSNVDLIMLIGYDYVEDIRPSMWSVGVKKRICRISPIANPVKKFFKPDLDVIGSVKETLNKLNKMKKIPHSARVMDLSQLLNRKRAFMAESEKKGDPILPQKIIKIVNEVLGKDGILVSDVGLHRIYATLFSDTYSPNTFLTSCGCSTFGFGLPAAMAARLAYPNKKIIAVVGDGGFHSNSQDLETAVRYNLPFVLIVMKDNCMGLIKMYQNLGKKQAYPPTVEFGPVDFVKLAEANGCNAERVEVAGTLKDAIIRGINSRKPTVIEVPVQYKYNFGGALKSRGLEDFIDKK